MCYTHVGYAAPPQLSTSVTDNVGYADPPYYATPRAARTLLTLSKPRCNLHKQDYSMREYCTTNRQGRGTCQAPPRALYQRNARLLGWGLFAQNHTAVPSYHNLARGKAGINFTIAFARSFEENRCRDYAASR